MIPAYRQIQTKDFEISQVQTNTANTLNILIKVPMNDGTLLEDQVITTSDTPLNHGLGRRPVGYLIVTKNAAEDVYQTAMTENFLTLKATGSVTVNVWVF